MRAGGAARDEPTGVGVTSVEARAIAHRLLGKWATQWCEELYPGDTNHALVCDTVTENLAETAFEAAVGPDMMRVLRDPTIPVPGEDAAANAVIRRGCRKCLAGDVPYWHPADRPCPVSSTT